MSRAAENHPGRASTYQRAASTRFSVLRANLRSSGKRLWAAGAAVAISVAFIVAGTMLVDSMTRAVETEAQGEAAGADLIIDSAALGWAGDSYTEYEDGGESVEILTPEDYGDIPLAEAIEQLDSVAAAEVVRRSWLDSPVEFDQELGGYSSSGIGVSNLVPSRDYPLAAGRLPAAADELLISEGAAEWNELDVGDSYLAVAVRWEEDDSYTVVDSAEFTVVGITETSIWGPEGFLTPEGMERIPADPEDGYESGYAEPEEIRVVLPEDSHGDRRAQEAVQQQIVQIVEQLIASGELDMLGSASSVESGLLDTGTDEYGAEQVGDLEIATNGQIVDRWVAERTGDAQMLLWVAVGFGSIAVFVSALVIANTFQVIIASRQRTMALIRAVGGTAAQLRRATLAEGAVLGLLGGAAGVLIGWGIAQGFVVTMNYLVGGGESIPTALPNPVSIAVGLGLGLLMAFGSALYPALKAGRISPMVALRPADVTPPERSGSLPRLVLGAVITAAGIGTVLYSALARPATEPNPALDYYGVFNADPVAGLPMPLIGLVGGFLGFLGVLVLAKTVVPPLAQALGRALAALPPLKVPARLAGQNARQVPGRTTATSAALLVGVTLVMTMIMGAATAQKLLYTELAESYPVDGAVASLQDDQLEVLENSHLVTGISTVPGFIAGDAAGSRPVLQLDAEAFDAVAHLPLAELQSADPVAYVGWNAFAQVSFAEEHGTEQDMLTLEVNDSAVQLPVELAAWAPYDAVLVPEMLWSADWQTEVEAGALFSISENADHQELWELENALSDGDYGAATVEGAIYRMDLLRVIDVVLLAVLALLGASVLVAVLGVSNTLSLSVFERQREAALLRANGMTRRSLGATISIEALLLAAVALILGTVLGGLFGWAGVATLVAREDWTVAPSVPWLRLAAVWAVTLLAAALAAWLPARRLSRVQPAAGLSHAA
ncbi:ABC transporter permease [Nesterenkonia ebinurensis]|uniref:ABC transporter permease n=1 Tax=Nesterenkonia ebinurensis TaxID=2608252 RepID=UPI00123E046D|nr:FtsX family ABC transporter permease [Nesterenkonia ebinurensis]